MRRYGENRRPDVKYIARPGAYGIIAQGRDLLLTLQILKKAEMQLPGGGIDPGETPTQALHREVFEETGWLIATPRRVGTFRRFVFMPEYDLWAEKICMIYRAMPVRRMGPPREEFHEARWMDAEAATQALGNSGDRFFAQQHASSLR